MKPYSISLEISGATAMWTRPDTGATPVSYPVPPWSAAKGIFESIVRLKNVIINPTAVEICSPIIYHDYTTNYGGPLRKGDQITNNDSFQHKATVLINVCYKLYATIEDFKYIPKSLSEAATLNNINSRHYCQERFNRRLKRGQFYDTPCLGWREFVPDYIGSCRDSTKKIDHNEKMTSFLYCVFDPETGVCKPRYVQNLSGREIVNGRLKYAE
ncbi:MAG TPA: CRISPR-associated protein Cas5 [Nitrospirae bacterium]|nr:CRISPR-associated protein Cas5 [bacterium BMS3Abin06]HDH13284.1 CRISPR-associated protein Cas5 [Nitrospirota bacterium]HDZ01748.1 CRISPR-associated protein Cas5 [Nitrospirota bacterium]